MNSSVKVHVALGPLLDNFAEEIVEPCEGTSLYAVQSCANHSCRPSTQPFKSPEDLNGAAVLIAERDIAPGDEITISYIPEEGSLEERRAALADYGFVCTCERCLEESGGEATTADAGVDAKEGALAGAEAAESVPLDANANQGAVQEVRVANPKQDTTGSGDNANAVAEKKGLDTGSGDKANAVAEKKGLDTGMCQEERCHGGCEGMKKMKVAYS